MVVSVFKVGHNLVDRKKDQPAKMFVALSATPGGCVVLWPAYHAAMQCFIGDRFWSAYSPRQSAELHEIVDVVQDEQDWEAITFE